MTGQRPESSLVAITAHPPLRGKLSPAGSPGRLVITARANACYTADALPAIFGPLLLPDPRGRMFVNPVYAFDGCFGTA